MSNIVLRDLDDWLNKIQMAEIPDYKPRYPEFRVSSLPYCPILFLDKIRSFNEDAHSNSYNMDFFTKIGTIVHENFQHYAKYVHPSTFYGNWKCSKTLKTKVGEDSTTITKCTHKQKEICTFKNLKVKCPHGEEDCKPNFEYEEILFDWHGLSGHMDCLIKLNGKWIILDWKTTGSYLFENPKEAVKRGYYPSAKYIEQIESYAVLLKYMYDIEATHYVICYVKRENPTDTTKNKKGHKSFIYEIDKNIFDRRRDILKKQINNHKLVKSLLNKIDSEKIDKIIENKPCHSKLDFERNMKAAFFGSEECGHCSSGLCFDDAKLKKYIKNSLKDIKND